MERENQYERDSEDTKQQQVEARIVDLLPAMVSEVMNEVQNKYGQVAPTTVGLAANFARSYFKQHLLRRPSDLGAWGDKFMEGYFKSAGYEDSAHIAILRKIVIEFQKQLYYILNEEELKPLGQYLRDNNIKDFNLLELPKDKPQWTKFISWYLQKGNEVKVLENRFNWQFTARRPAATDEAKLADLEREEANTSPDYSPTEDEFSFGHIDSNIPRRSPNLDEQEGGRRD